MNIHPVKDMKGDTNRFCGPAAISIATGMSSGEAARLLRHITGERAITGTDDYTMQRAFRMCGIEMKNRPLGLLSNGGDKLKLVKNGEVTKPTIAQWLKATVGIRTSGRVFLISAGHHWQIISGRRFCCARTRKIISITDKKAHRRARIKLVWELIPTREITTPAVAIKPKKIASRRSHDLSRKELEAFLRQHGIPKGKLVRWDSSITDYVIPACDAFSKGFSTIHYDWSETFERLQHCFENPSELLENDGHYSC